MKRLRLTALFLLLVLAGCESDSTTIVRVESDKKKPPPTCEEAFKACVWECRLIANRQGQAKCDNECFAEFQKCKKRRGRSER